MTQGEARRTARPTAAANPLPQEQSCSTSGQRSLIQSPDFYSVARHNIPGCMYFYVFCISSPFRRVFVSQSFNVIGLRVSVFSHARRQVFSDLHECFGFNVFSTFRV